LKKGAYDVFRDDDDKEAQKFMDTDIDQLLEQSSRKVTYGETATTSLSSGLGSFSKASFVTTTGDGDEKDVDLDDPDFWSKAVGLEAPPEDMDPDMALIINDGTKRSRKQVEVYDPHFAILEAERMEKERLAQEAEEEQERKDLIKLERMLRKDAERVSSTVAASF
jgi:chromodomain-helicase-DNA-binding protein 7